MEYREADVLCDEQGMVLLCWHPLEIELESGDIITGDTATLMLESLKQESETNKLKR